MLVLVGLGNPGAKYARHRHNVGFMAVDAIAEAHGFGPERSKFNGLIREGALSGGVKAIVLKPQTYMNESGQSVGALAQFYKVDAGDIVVFYDELDLAPGKVKAKRGGGAAGHNGIRSIDAHLGNDFRRVRIGIGHPGDKSKVTGHVLGDFAKADAEWLDPLLAAIADAAPSLPKGDDHFLTDLAKARGADRKREPAPLPRAPKAEANVADTAKPAAAARGPMGEALQKLFKRKE